MPSLFGLTPSEIAGLLEKAGEKPYRRQQLLGWMYKRFASSFDDMSDLPQSLRQHLEKTVSFSRLTLAGRQEGEGAWAKRYLWEEDGYPLCESVLLKYRYGLTGCVSTQAGCPVGCAFCASSLLGFQRNLTRGEIIEEFIGMCRDQGERLGHLVFMGTGEPFLNYDAVMAVIGILSSEDCYGLSRRKVTVSTVGIPALIRKYAEDARGSRLAISLHAPDDQTRDRLIPMNKRYPVKSVIAAARDFSTSTGQRVTIEYMLLRDVNDSRDHAQRLTGLVSGMDCLVNLIPWNEVPGLEWRRPGPSVVNEFRDLLERNRVKVTVRRRLGGNIEAACGQLRRQVVEAPKT